MDPNEHLATIRAANESSAFADSITTEPTLKHIAPYEDTAPCTEHWDGSPIATGCWYEVEGGGPDCVVFAESAKFAALIVCEKQAKCAAWLKWLDNGSTPQSVARFEWRGNGMVGRCVVSLVSDEMRAILDAAELESDVAYEAAEFRSES